jgi:ribosomal protein S18 acetylase RimI-like enzyme
MENADAQQFWSDLGFEETWRIVQYRKSLGVPQGAPRAGSSKPAGRRAAKKTSRKRTPSRPRRR